MKFLSLSLTIFLASAIWSCGPNYHLRRAEHHLKKAELKGAVIDSDTVWRSVDIYVPEVSTDTVFRSIHGDTVRIEKDRLKIKYVKLPGDSVYIEGKCETDTIEYKTYHTVTKTIQATSWIRWWYLLIAAGVGLIIGFSKR
jgi:hypothetical protein